MGWLAGMLGSSNNKWIIRAPKTNIEEHTFYNRHRKDVITLFDVYCEVNGRLDEPAITHKYPPDFAEEKLFKSVREFTFPYGKFVDDDNAEESAVQLFTFVFTEGTGNFTYGYCRFAPSTGVCSCILSGYNYTSLFYKLLNHLAMVKTVDKIEAILTNGYHSYVPGPGDRLELNQVPDPLKFSCKIPNPSSLSTLNDDKILMEFFNVVGDNQMIALFTALLFERRIIITGKKLGQLTACCFALTKIIYPFHWQYAFIPLLPGNLLDAPSQPMPFIIGLPKDLYDNAQNKSIWSEHVLFDLDSKVFESPHVDNLPQEINVYLKHNLKLSSNAFLSDNFSRTFLRAVALIFGKYKSGFTRDPETKEQVYDSEKFISESRPSMAPFLKQILVENGASYFNGFVGERLRPTSKRKLHDEEFENEIAALEKRGFSLVFLQSTAPEAIQSAMCNMKDGATDVLGSLKGKMQSISIKNKFERFTPKSSRKKTKLKNLDPLYVDASQYRVSSLDHQDSSTNNGQNEDDGEEEEEDLIDFSDPLPASNQNELDNFLRPTTSTSNGSSSTLNFTRDSGMSVSDGDRFPALYPVLDGFSPPSTSSSNHSSNRQSNGSYGLELSKFPECPVLKENGQTKKPSSNFNDWEKFE